MTPPDANKMHPTHLSGSTGGGLKQRLSPRKLWFMRLMAAVLVPVLLLGTIEAGLRVAGIGYPTSFFLPGTVDGEDFLFINHKYTHRFFPAGLTRSPIPHRILAEKPSDTYRIFVFGESAANGDPDSAYGFGRHLEILLEERYPGTNFEVVCTAITAINSHAILPIARECAKLDGDLWIIYMGNNEMVGTFGAGTVFSSKAPPLAAVRAILAIKSTRLGQLLDGLLQRFQGDSSAPEAWAGIDMFSENLLRPNDPGRLKVYENFGGNLDDILKAGRKANVPILLSTVASNLRNCAPFASLHAEGLSTTHRIEWESLYEKGKSLEVAGSYEDALSQYSQAAAIDPTHAELQFRIARCMGYSGNWKDVKSTLEKARDYDGLVVRADTRINQVIETSAAQLADEGIILVDPVELLAKDSPRGIPGQELFYEHVHYTLLGNYVMARIFADKMIDLLPDRITATDQKAWIDPGACHMKLAVTLWDQIRLWNGTRERLSAPPFNARATNAANLAYFEKLAETASARMNPQIDRNIYERALAENPDDYHLHARYGFYLENNGAVTEALPHLQWVCDTFPDFEGGHQELGIALFILKRYDEAKEQFERVLELRPNFPRALKGLELIENDPRNKD